MMIPQQLLSDSIEMNIQHALAEDIGKLDITAQLIPHNVVNHAQIMTREHMILAGTPWVNHLFETLDPSVTLIWLKQDGEAVKANEVFLELRGNARSLLSGERIALNFLQTLSAVATKVSHYQGLLPQNSKTKIIDTRKTIPGLRIAQKYAVKIGGGENHRLGLFDAFLIKENHIMATGSITKAIQQAKIIAPNKPIETEVENFTELEEALSAGSDIIMLDNFDLEQTQRAVHIVNRKCKLEASGGIELSQIADLAKTGIDYISMGDLTKNLKAIDLSMRFI